MKNLVLTCLLTLISTLHVWGQGFKIQFDIKSVPDCQVMVSERIPDMKDWYVDSLVVKQGKAVYQGKVAYPRMTTFVFTRNKEDFLGSVSVFLDNSSNITITGENLRNSRVEGCKAHDAMKRLREGSGACIDAYSKLANERSRVYGNKVAYDSINVLCRAAYDKMFDYFYCQPNYAANPAMPYMVYEYFLSDTEKLEKALAKFDDRTKGNGYLAYCKEELARQKRSAIGQQAFDFELLDVEGKKYRLSDYKGRYVLLEFSASWCGWCKKEIPYLQKVYDLYGQRQDFSMFTINLDKTRELWEKDVKKEQLPWKVISDLKAFDGPVPKAFNVHGIPAIFLIAPDGTIVDKGLRGEEMIKTIGKYLNKGQKECVIRGTMQGLPEGRAFLYGMHNQLLDSCEVVDGRYTLKGNIEKGQMGYLFFKMKPEYQKPFASFIRLYLQPTEMGVSAQLDDVRNTLKFENAPVQDELTRLRKAWGAKTGYKEAGKLDMQIQEAFKRADMETVHRLGKQRTELLKTTFAGLFQEDPALRKSEAAAYLVWEKLLSFTADEQLKALAWFDASLQDNYYLADIRESATKELTLGAGSTLPDFTAQDMEGRTYTKADFKGKYLFLEFSASWCGWCKKEVPFIRKAYEAMKDKGVAFVTLMMDDKREAWVNDVRKQGIEWLTLSDLKGMKNSPMKKAFNLAGVPASFLVGPDGKILARDLRGDEVLNIIKKYAGGEGIAFVASDFKSALNQAEKEGKKVFVDCYTSWCGPCRKMAETVFVDSEVANYFNAHFINLKVDMEKGEGPRIGADYQVKAYPTFLFLDGNEKVAFRMVGGMQKDDFLTLVKKRMAGETVASLAVKFEGGDRAVETVSSYLMALVADMRYEQANKVWKVYWQGLTAEQKTAKANWPLAKQYINNVYGQDFLDLVAMKQHFQENVGVDAYAAKVYQLVSATIANSCNEMIFEEKFDPAKLEKMEEIVRRAQCDTTGFLKAMLAITKYASKKQIGKAISTYCNSIEHLSDNDRFSLTMQLNGAAYKYGNAKECRRTYEVISTMAARFGWDANNGMVQAMLQGLQERQKKVKADKRQGGQEA